MSQRMPVPTRDEGQSHPDDQTTGIAIVWPSPKYWVKVAAGVIGIIIAVQLLLRLEAVLLVVVASFVLALGLQPALDWMETRGVARWQAMVVVILGGALATAAALGAIVPVLIGELDEIMAAIPEVLADLRESGGPLGTLVDRFNWTAMMDGEGSGLLPAISGLAGAIFNTITVLILTPYFAYSFPAIKRFVLRLLHREDRPEFLRMVNESVDRISGYIAGNLTVSLIAVVASFLALWLLGIPFPLALAFWIGITDLIPVVGVFLGAAPVVLLAAQEGTGVMIGAILFIVIYQQIENYVIGPRVMKRAVDLSPPSVILALMIGGSLAGVLGALLALPVAALIKVVVTDYVVARRMEEVRVTSLNGGRPQTRRRPADTRPLP